jgi:hypothetical protein
MFYRVNPVEKKTHLHLHSVLDASQRRVSSSTIRNSSLMKQYERMSLAEGGSRTAWEKQWFAHSNPFTTKVDFNRERAWPTPVDYTPPTTFGVQPTKVSFPSWSIATRLETDPTFIQDTGPSPNTYEAIDAFHKLTAKNTHITLKSRPGGTQLSTKSSTSNI